MGKFWRSLNLKLVMLVYLTLLQVAVCLDRHAQVFTKFPFTVEETSIEHGFETTTTITFHQKAFLDKAEILTDVIRLMMLWGIFFWPRFVGFPILAILLLLFFQPDAAPLEIRNASEMIHLSNLKNNPFFRLSLFNELMIRITVIYLWRQRNFDFLIERNPSFSWKFSIADLFALVALTAITAAVMR